MVRYLPTIVDGKGCHVVVDARRVQLGCLVGKSSGTHCGLGKG